MQPQTLDDILEEVAVDYEFSTTYSTTSTEYTRRRRLANRYASEWASRRQYRWAELLTTTTITADGTTTLDLPSDFSPGNMILHNDGTFTFGETPYTIINSGDLYRYTQSGDFTVYFTGNPASGYSLTFNTAPPNGTAIDITYYSTDTATDSLGVSQAELEGGGDKTKCPRPRFIVYNILAALFRVDEDVDAGRSLKFEQLAEREMNLMLGLANSGNINESSVIEDSALVNGFPPIGR